MHQNSPLSSSLSSLFRHLKMESGETLQMEKIAETVVAILKQADLAEATEQKVRTMAADRLGMDPNELSFKWIVRRCVETYLLSLDEEELDKVEQELPQGLEQDQSRVTFKPNTLAEEEGKVEQHQRTKQDGGRVICKLSDKRRLAVHNFRGETLVAFRDYHEKNGKLLPSARGISLSTEQWSAFRKSIPDIQAAITKMESRIRSKDARKLTETDMPNSAIALIPMEMKQIEDDLCSATASVCQGVVPMEIKQIEEDLSEAERKQIDADMSIVETASAPRGLVSVQQSKQIKADESNSVTTTAVKGVIPMETKQVKSDITNSVTSSVTLGVIPVETKQIEADVSNAKTTRIEGFEATLSNSVNTSAPEIVVPNGPKHTEADISNSVSAFGPQGLVPSKTTRLDGKNYYCWAHQMEIFLKRLKIAYVLTDRRPSIPDRPKANFEEIALAKSEVQKWVDDDSLCRHSILSCLSDHLFDQYSNKTNSAKELWEELKLAYDEDFGTTRCQVNKYIQFQMVDGISVLEQAHELCRIANSIVASGMWIDENFHVSAIISKLPPSWKEYRAKLMREEFITVIMLMHRLGVEEESRNHGEKEGFSLVRESREDNGLEVTNGDFMRPAMHLEMERGNRFITCFRCGQKGHISKHCQQRKVYIWEKSSEGNEVIPVAVEANTQMES